MLNYIQQKILDLELITTLKIVAFIFGVPTSIYGLSILQGKILTKIFIPMENCKYQIINTAFSNDPMSSKKNDLGISAINCFNAIDTDKSLLKFYQEDFQTFQENLSKKTD